MNITEILTSGIVGVVSGGITGYLTTRLKIKEEEKKWQKEFAQKYAELAIESPVKAQKISQQFGIAVLVICTDDDNCQGSNKLFTPPNSRMSVGRGKDCDIIIDDPIVSRTHMAFKSNEKEVYAENLGAANQIKVNNTVILTRIKLKSGDEISLGKTIIRYLELK